MAALVSVLVVGASALAYVVLRGSDTPPLAWPGASGAQDGSFGLSVPARPAGTWVFGGLILCTRGPEVTITSITATEPHGGLDIGRFGLPRSPGPAGWTGTLSMPGTLEARGYDPSDAHITTPCGGPTGLDLAFEARRTTPSAAWTRGLTISYRADGRTYTMKVQGNYTLCGDTGAPPSDVAHC